MIQQLNTTPEAPQEQPQSAAVAQPEKPKAQTPAKSKKAAETPAAAPEKKPEPEANPTTAEASVSASPEAPGQAASEPEPDPTAESKAIQSAAAENAANEAKIRDLVGALLKQGRMKECKAIISGVGAKGVSSIPPEQYTTVWEQLVALDREVNQNAAD